MHNLQMNERAWTVADHCAERADELRVAVHRLASGARVIDAGIDARLKRRCPITRSAPVRWLVRS